MENFLFLKNKSCTHLISPLPVLPIDIIVEILCRLPVKTVLSLRCLSKQFCYLIDSPHFIDRQLQFSYLSPKLFVSENYTRNKFALLNINTLDRAYDVDIPPVDTKMRKLVFNEVIGSCDGLLALLDRFNGTIIIGNISTRKFKILPMFFDDKFKSLTYGDDSGYGFVRGAGFDDYKLVRVASARLQKTSLSVYSLKAESWSQIADFPSYLTFRGKGMAAFVNGTLNWLCCDGSINDYKILSFALNSNNLYFTSLPDSVADDLNLSVFGERLCLLEYKWPELDYNIWVMKEYSVKDSWIKMYTLSLPLFYPRSFAFSMHMDKLFFHF